MATDNQEQQQLSTQDLAFLERMQAECEELEAYRLQQMRSENREVSLDQAARDWIEQYMQAE